MNTATLPARTAGRSAAIADAASRKFFSFPVVVASLLVVLAVLSVRGRFNDPDMWWHLKTGEVIWTSHSVPTVDQFSYTAHDQALVPQEWFSETLIYAAYRAGGYSGLMVWLCFFSAALLIAGYLLCSLYSGNAKIGFVGAMALWFFSTVGLSVRGQLVGYLLLAIELLLLHLGRTRNPRWFYPLPLLFLLWVNCHASFFFGLVVMAVVLACSFFDFQLGALVALRWEKHQRRALAIAMAISSAAVFINPVGLKQVAYPLNTMFQQPVNLGQIEEWKVLLLSDPRGAGLAVLLATIALLLILRRSQVLFLHEAVLLGIAAWLAINHQRLAIVFGILAAPVLSRLLADLWDKYDAANDRRLTNAILIAAAAIAVFIAFPSRRAIAKQLDAGSPVAAVHYLNTHPLSGNMLNSYGYGGYLIWALPSHPVFIDGRADLYEWAGVLDEFGMWAMLQSDPNTLLDKYHVEFCLLERDAPMTHVLPLMPNWKQIYSDDASVIFVRTAPEPGSNE